MSTYNILRKRKAAYWLRILISIDQLFNVIIFNGYPDETISSKCGKAMLRRQNGTSRTWDPVLIAFGKCVDKFFWLVLKEKNHCINRIEWDE